MSGAVLECAIGVRMGARLACGPVRLAAVPSGEAAVTVEGGDAVDVARAVEAALRSGTLPAVVRAGDSAWKVESAPAGRLAGRVAVVTGSAQGFGRGIAEELAAEGCAVVIADLNDALAGEVAQELNGVHGPGTAMAASMNVADKASIDAALDAVTAAWGGIDLFVANAGVLKAGGLEEMDEAAFDFVTRVNYKGYFLCVQAVAPIMKKQHACQPSAWFDIIQINSKSGLQGSRKNFAYAGGKFGGIGLTQSFAMELVSDGIKVNSVCPGNYFEGPLWSDPERGLFVQYLRAGKVPGATCIEDVKRYYTSLVPMGRGCLPVDVARAILYLHEQAYETGQALPVTGGQVMLR